MISLNEGKIVMLGEENWRDIRYGVQIGEKWCVGSTNSHENNFEENKKIQQLLIIHHTNTSNYIE